MKFTSEMIKKAWAIRKAAAEKFGCKVTEIAWGECLRMAKAGKVEKMVTVYYWPEVGFTTEEPEKWIFAYDVNDPEDFIRHMEKYNSIPAGPWDRETYEKTCREFGVEPMADEDFNSYTMEYGDFGMSHYHTDPKNRHLGISNTIHQQRFFEMKREKKRNKKKEVEEASAPLTYEKEGQLWEPCRCGKEPVYMPLHLCDNCWPGK